MPGLLGASTQRAARLFACAALNRARLAAALGEDMARLTAGMLPHFRMLAGDRSLRAAPLWLDLLQLPGRHSGPARCGRSRD